MKEAEASPEEVDELFEELSTAAEAAGYNLNPDMDTTMPLIEGLVVNSKRYGYRLCPCRLTSGSKEADLDIICPCDYRDPDLDEYGTCYCGLYVSGDVLEGKAEFHPIPERRPPAEKRETGESSEAVVQSTEDGIGVFRCRVCGYLCARSGPPETCPICKAGRERFEPFSVS